jgi:hypothetical protein
MFEHLISALQQYLDSGDESSLDYLEDEITTYSEDKLELIADMLNLFTAYVGDDRLTKRIKRVSQICKQASYA